MIELTSAYNGRPSNGVTIPPGVYAEDDPALLGLAGYLVETRHATRVDAFQSEAAVVGLETAASDPAPADEEAVEALAESSPPDADDLPPQAAAAEGTGVVEVEPDPAPAAASAREDRPARSSAKRGRQD